MDEFDDILGGLTVTDGPDGTMDIEGVPIFNVGLVRGGKTYDEAWANRAIEAHNKLKEADGYIPPVFIGHTKEGEEKPAVGLFDNLRLQGSKLLADLKRVSADIYKQLKDGNWPSRSIEATNSAEDNRVLGLALLGSSTPACKFKPLHFKEMRYDGNPEDVEAVRYDEYVETETPIAEEIKMEDEVIVEEPEVKAEEVVEEPKVEDAPVEDVVEPEVKAEEAPIVDRLKENEMVDVTARLKAVEAENAAIKADLKAREEAAHRSSIDAFVDKMNVQGRLPRSVIHFEGDKEKASLCELMYTMKAEELTKMEQFLQTLDTVAKFKESAPAGDEAQKLDPDAALAAKQLAWFEEHKAEGKTIKDAYNAVNPT